MGTCVVFQGHKFNKWKKDGYYRAHYDGHVIYLHRAVWESVYGKIPDDYQVHHIDKNKDNNDISNLMLISTKEHLSEHGKESFLSHKDFQLQHLDSIRPLAVQWHGSAEGKEWHSAHGKKVFREMPLAEKTCEFCGNTFSVKLHCLSRARFCSNNCRAAFRRKSGADNTVRICPVCNNEFTVNKYSSRKCCSLRCNKLLCD